MMNRRNFFKAGLMASLAAGAGIAKAESSEKVKKTKKYTSVRETDVLVVGAGAAGCPTAIAAARGGAKVILLDEDSLIGGAPVDMYVSYICGGPRLGIISEMCDLLLKKYNITPHKHQNGAMWFFPTSVNFALMEMIAAEKNISIVTNAPVCGAIMSDKGKDGRRKILGVEYIDSYNKLRAIKAKIVVDATGTGSLSEFAGVECMFGREAKSEFNERLALDKHENKVQNCTQMFMMQAFRPDANIQTPEYWKTRINNRLILDSGVGFTSFRPREYARKNITQYLVWGAHGACDTRDNVALAHLQADIIKRLMPLQAEMWKFGYAMNLAPKIGVRECRRVVGDQILTSEDLLKQTGEVQGAAPKYPDDGIAQGRYVLDCWGRPDIAKNKIDKIQLRFAIPYGCTLAKGVENLMLAGKHISGTSLAASAYRVQPIVAGVGQAVGTAAAMAIAAKTQPRSIDINALKASLKTQGIL